MSGAEMSIPLAPGPDKGLAASCAAPSTASEHPPRCPAACSANA